MTNNPRSVTRRPSRTVPTTAVAVAMIAAGGAGAWLLGTRMFTGHWPAQSQQMVDDIAGTPLGATAVVLCAIVLAVVALLLLGLALWPGRARRIAVLPDEIPGQTVLGRSDMASLVRQRVQQVDGVESVHVNATAAAARVRADSVLGDTQQVRQAVGDAAEDALTQLRPVDGMRAKVRVRRAG